MPLSTVKRIAWLLLAVGLVGAGTYAYRTREQGQSPASPASTKSDADDSDPTSSDVIELPREDWDAAGIQIQVAEKKPLAETVELTGKIALNEDRLVHIFPLVEGRVDEVKVRFGQRVQKGQLLVVVQSKEVGQLMLQLFQDRLKLEFAEVKDQWVQEIALNTQAMIQKMREGGSIEEIENAMKDRLLGDSRQVLMTAYVAYLKSRSHLERLSPLSTSGAVPARQIMEAEAEANATRATLQSLLEQVAQDAVQASRLSTQAVKELQTNISVAETNLKILGFNEEDLQDIDPAVKGEKLAHYPVTVPFDGTVISKDVVLLERVGPDQQILTIADLSTVWVTADIYETHLPVLAQLDDQPVSLRCDAWPGREFPARIFYTGDVVQESTRTIALRASADNADGLLKPGMFVTVILPSLQTQDVVQVPLSAIQDHEGESFVYVQTGDDEFVRQDVTLGRRNRNVIEVRSGVDAGDRVVTSGGFALKSRMLADLLAE